MGASFQAKRTTLTFLAQICTKRNLELEIQKTNFGIRISILDIPCVPIFRKNGQLWLFCPKFSQKWILGWGIQKANVGIKISILEIPCVPIFRQNGQLCLFGPKFDQKWILWSEFQKSKSGFKISSSKIPCEPIFSQMGNSEFFGLNLGKLPNYLRCFGSNIVEGVVESWVEAEMSWVEVDGAEWRLKWAGWRWMELGGAGCTV